MNKPQGRAPTDAESEVLQTIEESASPLLSRLIMLYMSNATDGGVDEKIAAASLSVMLAGTVAKAVAISAGLSPTATIMFDERFVDIGFSTQRHICSEVVALLTEIEQGRFPPESEVPPETE